MPDMQVKNMDEIPGFRTIGRRHPKAGEYFLDKRGQPQKANFDYALDMFDILVPVDEYGNDVPQETQIVQSPTTPGHNNAQWSQAYADFMTPLYSMVVGALEIGAPNKPEEVKTFQMKLLSVWGQHAVDTMQRCVYARYGEQGHQMVEALKKEFSIEMCLHPELIPKPVVEQPPTPAHMSPGVIVAPPTPPTPQAPPPPPIP